MFKSVLEIMSNNEHLTIDGLHNIINIKSSMNWSLSDLVKSEFINFTPVERLIILTNNIPDSNWIAGFITGEATFDVLILKENSFKIGHRT